MNDEHNSLERHPSSPALAVTASDPPAATTDAGAARSSQPPPLKFKFKWLRPTLYFCFLVVCNVLIPCLIYYLVKIYTTVDDKELIGISSAALGVSSCFDAPFRLWKLVKFHDRFGPLNDAKWWHLDSFSHLYTLALLVFAFPLAIAPAIPLYNFFLFSVAMFTAPVGIVALLSLHSWRLPIWLSSDPPRTPSKPAVFYMLEDVVAVDFGYGKKWRKDVHARYEASPVFRALMWNLTLYWGLMCFVLVGITAAVTWAAPLRIAFGLVLGDFFIWAGFSAFGCWVLACEGLRKEKAGWAKGIEMGERLADRAPSIAPPNPSSSSTRVLTFTSHAHLRHRLVLSLLSRRPIKIDRIRPDDDQPGLREYEVSFLRLLEKMTEGTRVEISYTGTAFLFHPGTIAGGTFTHQCPLSRSVGWFLEPLLALAPFGKKDLVLTLKGITTDGRDASVDTLRTSALPHLAMFLDKEGLELRITKRGHPPLGGGEITFTCPSVRAVKSGFDFTNVGRVGKIRGIAHSVRVSPQLSNRLVAAARSVLNRYIPDVYIYTDVYRGEDSGKSPGYAITLLASSTSHVLHSSETTSCPPPPDSEEAEGWTPPSPEDLGILAARELLNEIRRGGCVDRGFEWLVALMLVLGGEDVGKATVAGPMDPFFIQHLRDLKGFFGTTFKIKAIESKVMEASSVGEDDLPETDKVEQLVLSCVGTGFTNTAKRTG